MRNLGVYLEINGKFCHVGNIIGNSSADACFQYSKAYLESADSHPISIALPLSGEIFSPERTKNFFEGLLPEGFSRRAVADWIKADENDYLSILAVLGRECIGAIKIMESGDNEEDDGYELLSMDKVKELAAEGASRSTQILMETHLSLAGASGKVGLYYDEPTGDWYLPRGNAPSTHIVKQSHVRFSKMVLNEQMCMLTAKGLGIDVPESFIVNTGKGEDSDILYATRRYDRVFTGKGQAGNPEVPHRLHQEDFAQALGIPASEKYERTNSGYLRRMFELIRRNCTNPISAQNKLWKLICFNFMIGNTDCHIKNYSLLYGENLRQISLAPAYDIVATGVYDMTNEMSFFIDDELDIRRMNRSTFANASDEIGMTMNQTLKIFDEVAAGFESALSKAAETLMAEGFPGVAGLKDMILETGGYVNVQR